MNEEIGTVFPPRDEWDVAAYDPDECVAGYREHKISDAAPGDNRSPAYRWGWANARQDATYMMGDDGLGAIRSAYIKMARNEA